MIRVRRVLRFALLIMMLFPVSQVASCEDGVTNYNQVEGFGAQFHHIIAAAVYAEFEHKPFLYTPFSSMEHNYDNDPDFLPKKEWLINFIGNFDLNRRSDILPKTYKGHFDKNVADCAKSNVLRKMKAVFRVNKNRNEYFDDRHCIIAIHIRRPNSQDNRTMGTTTPDNFFSAVIKELRKKYKKQNPQFHLYSQGNPKDFALFVAHDVVLHLNESVENTFIGMVLADVLVTSASSLSYTAGLLSDGIVYYIPFWHAPLPGWISANTLVPSSLAQEYH